MSELITACVNAKLLAHQAALAPWLIFAILTFFYLACRSEQ